MNTYTLESFINFCDDMMIAEEAINVKDIKKAIITLFEKLLDKVTEFILKCTKNKSVKVDKDFAKEFHSIKKDINDLIDEMVHGSYFSFSFDEGHESIKSLNDRITELNKMSVSGNENNFSLMNTYEIFKEVTKLKDKIRNHIRFMKDAIYDDFDTTEEKRDRFYLKICECRLRLHQTVYSKIKDLK